MNRTTYTEHGIEVRYSTFCPQNSRSNNDGSREYCAILTSDRESRPFAEELDAVIKAYDSPRTRLGNRVKPVFKRYFLSDITNQAPLLPADSDCAVSVIGQPPLDGSRIALWVYLIEDAEVASLGNGFFKVSHGGYSHFWQGCASFSGKDSETATVELLSEYSEKMAEQCCSIADNCMRTWFFVRDVDVNYSGMVRGRNCVFSRCGLTPKTHFIASTGICGANADRTATVTMDTYTVKGLDEGQTRYLYAPTHLNPTHQYGVAFERGVRIDYGHRRHVLISGTASINNRGQVEHVGDIVLQTRRMWENVETLLAEADCGFDDVMHIIVYLRDVADYTVVSGMFRRKFPDIPTVIVLAPVCRPEWLVEMECMAIRRIQSDFNDF